MDLYLFLAGDITQGVVARDRVTTAGEDIGVDILLCDVYRLLAVELVGDHHEVVVLALLLFLLRVAAADEGYELAPARLTTAVLAVELVDIFLAQHDGLLAQCLEEVLALVYLVELRQLVDDGLRVLEPVLLEEVGEERLALLLHLTTVASQDGLYFCLRLGCADEVDPCGLHVLRLRGENLHLVAAVELMAQWHELVVHLRADTVRA